MCNQDQLKKIDRYRSAWFGRTAPIWRAARCGNGDAVAAGCERGRSDGNGRHRDDPGWLRRLLLRAPCKRHGSGCSRMAGHFRFASGVPPDGQAACRIRLRGAGGESVLSGQESADRRSGREDADCRRETARAGFERDDTDDRCEGVHRLARPATVGRAKPEDGHAGVLHGRTDQFRTAAAVPDRVGAVASFHGGGLATDTPNSPRLQAAKTKAQFLIEIAENDDKRSPEEKNVLKDTFAKAKLLAEIEDLPGGARMVPARFAGLQRASAGKAWSRLLALYSKALV